MKESKNIIYKITNKVNGKIYIGLTTQGLSRRMGEHKYRFLRCERDHKLYQAMIKYGFDNFKFEAICTAIDKNDLPYLEVLFIKKYNSFKNGYNMTIGGEMVSEETRQKLSKIFKGRKITWYDKILKSRLANPNRKDPKEYVAKGAKNINAKTYLVQFPDKSKHVITGIREFCRKYKLTHSNLFATASGGQKVHRGYKILRTFNDQSKDVDCKRLAVEMGGVHLGS